MEGNKTMEYKKINDLIYLRIDKDEKIVETITAVCAKEKINAGHFQGIGACDTAILSTYLPEKKILPTIPYPE